MNQGRHGSHQFQLNRFLRAKQKISIVSSSLQSREGGSEADGWVATKRSRRSRCVATPPMNIYCPRQQMQALCLDEFASTGADVRLEQRGDFTCHRAVTLPSWG